MTQTILKRNSNIELLRIIAMFMILIIHADFGILSVPSSEEMATDPFSTISRVFFEAFGIFGVNIFVAISGWFLINPNLERWLKFLFQCLFFSILIYIISAALGYTVFSFEGWEDSVLLRSYWFVISYLGLFILSPIINTYIEQASERSLRYFLIVFYFFQTVYTKDNAAAFINQGYSTFSFIGIYVFSNFSRKYIFGKLKITKLLLISILCIFINFMMGLIGITLQIPLFTSYMMNYCNLFSIAGSISIVLLFSKLKINNSRIINYISASAFAVYLFHANPNIYKFFSLIIKRIYTYFSGIECLLMMFVFLLLTYSSAILIDRLRIYIWNKLDNQIK